MSTFHNALTNFRATFADVDPRDHVRPDGSYDFNEMTMVHPDEMAGITRPVKPMPINQGDEE